MSWARVRNNNFFHDISEKNSDLLLKLTTRSFYLVIKQLRLKLKLLSDVHQQTRRSVRRWTVCVQLSLKVHIRRERSAWLNKQTEHNFILFHFVFMWRTLPPPSFKQCSGSCLPLRTAGLLTDGKNRYFCVNIVNINILSLTSLSRTPQWGFTAPPGPCVRDWKLTVRVC